MLAFNQPVLVIWTSATYRQTPIIQRNDVIMLFAHTPYFYMLLVYCRYLCVCQIHHNRFFQPVHHLHDSFTILSKKVKLDLFNNPNRIISISVNSFITLLTPFSTPDLLAYSLTLLFYHYGLLQCYTDQNVFWVFHQWNQSFESCQCQLNQQW